MTYIIENANLFKHNELVRTSLLVDDGKILSVKPSFSQYRYMKMNAGDFLMTSTHVFYNDGLPRKETENAIKNYIMKRFLAKGCTTVLVAAKIHYLKEIDEKINQIRNFFKRSPLDFIVAVKIGLENLSVPFIQKCKQRRIPAIFVQLNNYEELYKIPWGWIREAMFPYNCPLIPVINGNNENEKKILETWRTILEEEKIPHIGEPLQENHPLSLSVLKKIGIYPKKNYLQAGGELSYNLYFAPSKQSLSTSIAFDDYHIAITVHKGVVIRAKNKIYYHHKIGEEIIIKRPSFFK